MRRPGGLGLGVALAVCLVGVAAAPAAEKDDAATDVSGGNWFTNWFSWGSKPAVKKPAPKPEKEKVAARPEEPPRPANQLDEATAERAHEQAILLRRLAVCDRLMAIAVASKDESLVHQVEQLERRAQMAYTQRTAHLSVGGAPLDVETQILDSHLGAGAASGHGAGSAAIHTVEQTDAGSRTVAREENR